MLRLASASAMGAAARGSAMRVRAPPLQRMFGGDALSKDDVLARVQKVVKVSGRAAAAAAGRAAAGGGVGICGGPLCGSAAPDAQQASSPPPPLLPPLRRRRRRRCTTTGAAPSPTLTVFRARNAGL